MHHIQHFIGFSETLVDLHLDLCLAMGVSPCAKETAAAAVQKGSKASVSGTNTPRIDGSDVLSRLLEDSRRLLDVAVHLLDIVEPTLALFRSVTRGG